MITTNNEPAVVQKSARRATRIICGGERRMRYLKKMAHRSRRHFLKIQLDRITKGIVDPDEFNDSLKYSHTATAWDVA